MLDPPGFEHACTHTETDNGPEGQRDPTHQPLRQRRPRCPVGARRRRGDRRRGHHQRDHLAKADTVVQVAGLEELESELASGHGGAVVQLTVGRPSPAER